MSNLNSYNQLINRFKAFADGHFLLKNFTYGAITLADLQKFGLYPFMHIVPVDVSYETGVKNFSFDVFFADLPREEENKAEYQKETLSDLQQIAEDLLGEITNHRVLFGYDCSVISSRLVPFEEEFSNVLTGWNLSITLQIPYNWSACDTPASFNDFIVYNQSTGESAILEFKDSIVREGGEVRLVNDVEFPDESYYYGTDENGNRGWFAFPTETGLTCETLGACSTITDIQTNIINLEDDVEDISANVVDLQLDFTTLEESLSPVATSGDYNDLNNLPTIPDAQIQSDWNQSNNVALDFIKNKPSIPSAQVNSDWNATSGVAEILNKPAIPTYTDFIEDSITNGVTTKAPSENAVYDALALKFNIPTGTTSDYLDGLGTPTPFPSGTTASLISHEVKLGSTMTKGTPVYVSGADGTNMVVSPASNGSEATSSKTMGLLMAGGNTNAKVQVITEGLLDGLNTSTATIGDAVWLGSTGTLIYGLANKPYAPLHLVFIGIVTRVNINNGEIFVKVQNGFELNEIHDVQISSPKQNAELYYNQSDSLWKNIAPQNKSRLLYQIFQTDFLGIATNVLAPFSATAILGTAINTSTSSIGGIGVVTIRSGTTGSSGAIIGNTNMTSALGGAIKPRPNQVADFVFRTPSAIAPFSTIRMGFFILAGTIGSDTLNGFYIYIYNGNFFGMTASNSFRSLTSTSFTLNVNTWYHGRITHNDTFITYQLYDQAGNLLWNNTLSTNIPSSTQSVNMGIQAYADILNTTATDLILLDYMSFLVPVETGTRGALS
jgi:hypothetical protein